MPLGYDSNGNRRYKYFSGQEVVIGYESSALKHLSNLYGAPLIERETFAPFPIEILAPPLTDTKKLMFLVFGTLCIVF